MFELNQKYKTALDNIKTSIQLSEELKVYLDEENDDDYKNLVQKFEASIHDIYEQVANESPLQLESLETYLLDEQFEGLYLPKVLGYSVLRGRVNTHVKYYRPQGHFSQILEFIINSSNFDQIKQRVGQSIQIGFALSSDIWITNLNEKVTNKRVKSFLQSQKLHKYLDPKIRNSALVKYRKQFQSLNFQTAVIPTNLAELQIEEGTIKDFLIYRAKSEFDNSNIMDAISQLVSNESLRSSQAFYEICIIIGLYFDLDEKSSASLRDTFIALRDSFEESDEIFFDFINAHSDTVSGGISQDEEKRLSSYLHQGVNDSISDYFGMLDRVNSLGYIHEDAAGAIREYYYKNEGLSIQNEAIRKSILAKLSQFLRNIPVTEYNEYFEINKTFTSYMDIFSNQKFNQDLKDLSLKFVRKCLKAFTDKRGKEYQEIKKFVKATFVEYGFMTEKEVAEIFKTKRKPRTAS